MTVMDLVDSRGRDPAVRETVPRVRLRCNTAVIRTSTGTLVFIVLRPLRPSAWRDPRPGARIASGCTPLWRMWHARHGFVLGTPRRWSGLGGLGPEGGGRLLALASERPNPLAARESLDESSDRGGPVLVTGALPSAWPSSYHPWGVEQPRPRQDGSRHVRPHMRDLCSRAQRR